MLFSGENPWCNTKMPARRTCMVPNCQSTTETKTMHRFPKDPYIGKQWIDAICNISLKNLPYDVVRGRRYSVCSDHFIEDTLPRFFTTKRLPPETIPTLRLPNPESSVGTNSHGGAENFSIDMSIEDDDMEDKTLITNIFSLAEFSPTFRYSDSLTLADITKLPVRKRESTENSNSELLSSGKKQKKLKLVSGHENSFNDRETRNETKLDDVERDMESRTGNPGMSQLDNIQNSNSHISEILNRPDSVDKLTAGEKPNHEQRFVIPLRQFIKKYHDVPKKVIKKSRSESKKKKSGITEDTAQVQIDRVLYNTDNFEKENSTDVAAFEIIDHDRPVEENSSILRNLFFNEGKNEERLLEGDNEKRDQTEFHVGEPKHIEFRNVGRELCNSGKNGKQQKYRTTIKLKRQSKESGTIQEDVFLIEHTFISSCNICPNHENDIVSCKVVRVE